MKTWILVAVALTAGAGSATAQADPHHPVPRDTVDNETYQGWKQYELKCARRHGGYAVGTSFAPTLIVSLKDGGTIPSQEAFSTRVCAGRPDDGKPSGSARGF